MNSDSGGGFPPDPGLLTTAFAITSSTEILNNQQMEINENIDTLIGNRYPANDLPNRTQTVSRLSTSINNDITNKKISYNTVLNDVNRLPSNTQALINSTNSKQNTTSEEITQKRSAYRYENMDTGPYLVYVENNSHNFMGKLSAIKVGEILFDNHPELDSRIKNIDSIGKNRIKIVFKDLKSANTFLNSSRLKQYNLESYIPKFVFFRQGIIKGVDIEYSEESIKQKIKEYDMHCKFTVDFVKRIHKKITNPDNTTKLVPTKTILVSFRCQNLPKYIAINHVIFPVEVYLQRVLLCNNCYRYGHLGKQCRSSTRCLKCKNNHATETCEETLSPKCFYCSGNHLTNNKNLCPEFKRQMEIKKLMSQSNISYQDASLKTPKNTYASVLTGEVNLDLLDDISQNNHQNTSKNSPIQSNYYTQTIIRPNKRQRPDKPNTTLENHKKIIYQKSLPSTSGGIVENPLYTTHITNSPSELQQTPQGQFPNPKIILEIIILVLDILKQKNSFEIQESDILNLIKSKTLST